jgi:hypothetical protein
MELIILALLQVKHWYVDFVLQNNEQVKYKGVYAHPVGISHSAEHVIGNLIVLTFVSMFYTISPVLIVLLSLLDGVVHYHIDWAKMNWGNRDITSPQFWNHLGLDQMAHQLCYLILVAIIA